MRERVLFPFCPSSWLVFWVLCIGGKSLSRYFFLNNLLHLFGFFLLWFSRPFILLLSQHSFPLYALVFWEREIMKKEKLWNLSHVPDRKPQMSGILYLYDMWNIVYPAMKQKYLSPCVIPVNVSEKNGKNVFNIYWRGMMEVVDFYRRSIMKPI
jgi:hypothetical protein